MQGQGIAHWSSRLNDHGIWWTQSAIHLCIFECVLNNYVPRKAKFRTFERRITPNVSAPKPDEKEQLEPSFEEMQNDILDMIDGP